MRTTGRQDAARATVLAATTGREMLTVQLPKSGFLGG